MIRRTDSQIDWAVVLGIGLSVVWSVLWWGSIGTLIVWAFQWLVPLAEAPPSHRAPTRIQRDIEHEQRKMLEQLDRVGAQANAATRV